MPAKIEKQAIRYEGPVRIAIPASVAYNLGAFQKSIASLVERLGCPTCFSGADCRFHLERDFVINEKAEVSTVTRGLEPQPSPWFSERAVTAIMPSKVSYDLKLVQGAVANIAGKLGCPQCCSGFDILFQQEREFLLDEAANIRAV